MMRPPTWWLVATAGLFACSDSGLFIVSPIEQPASLVVVYRPVGGTPIIRTSKPDQAIKLELEDGRGRLFLAAFHQGRRAPDDTLVQDCTVELGGEGSDFGPPDEVFSTAEFEQSQASVTWQREPELPADIVLRTRDCQVDIDPCAFVQVSEIALPTEYSYNVLAGRRDGVLFVGGEDTSGAISQPVLLRVEQGQALTMTAPGRSQGFVRALLAVSDTQLLGISGYDGRLWELNPQDGASRMYDLTELESLAGTPDSQVLIRSAPDLYAFPSLDPIVIPESMPQGVGIYSSVSASYVATADNFFRLINGELHVEIIPRIFTDRLFLGGDDDVVVGVTPQQIVLVRDLPLGEWRSESRPFVEVERFASVTGASGGRFVVGGLSLLGIYANDSWCPLHFPRQDFRKMAQTSPGVVYALAEDPSRLIRVELPPLN